MDEHHHGRSWSYVLLSSYLFMFIVSTTHFKYFNSLKVHEFLTCSLPMDEFMMDEVMNLVYLYISIFNSLKALAFKHVPCLWTMFMLCKYCMDS